MIQFLIDNWDPMWAAFLLTTRLALYSFTFALLIGVVIASFRVSPIPPLQRFASAYVSIFRNTPLLVIFFLFFFGFPKLGILFQPFPSAVLVLSLYTGAYLGEAIRSGINAVAVGQAEAARAIGLGFTQLLGLVVLPQALRTVVAPIGNLFIANAKNTSIALSIGVTELTSVSRELGQRQAQIVAALLGAGLLYVISLLLAGAIFGWIEQRVAIKR
ncbi:MAG TPA: amino acid ABC transporter permease [Euzebyales bacterium]|nr:amino acid ABC transporter permease [Euzebyales bacterium]